MRLLEQEHAAPHDRPDDLPAHREHRTSLRQHIAQLRAHSRQLRRERDDVHFLSSIACALERAYASFALLS